MHAVMVTYENDSPSEQLQTHPDNFAFARALQEVGGFISKTWINDSATFGGFYVFTGEKSAAAYLQAPLFQTGVVKDPSNRNLQIRMFRVFSELTAESVGPSRTARAE